MLTCCVYLSWFYSASNFGKTAIEPVLSARIEKSRNSRNLPLSPFMCVSPFWAANLVTRNELFLRFCIQPGLSLQNPKFLKFGIKTKPRMKPMFPAEKLLRAVDYAPSVTQLQNPRCSVQAANLDNLPICKLHCAICKIPRNCKSCQPIDHLYKDRAWAEYGASWLSLSPCRNSRHLLVFTAKARCHFTDLVLAYLAGVYPCFSFGAATKTALFSDRTITECAF